MNVAPAKTMETGARLASSSAFVLGEPYRTTDFYFHYYKAYYECFFGQQRSHEDAIVAAVKPHSPPSPPSKGGGGGDSGVLTATPPLFAVGEGNGCSSTVHGCTRHSGEGRPRKWQAAASSVAVVLASARGPAAAAGPGASSASQPSPTTRELFPAPGTADSGTAAEADTSVSRTETTSNRRGGTALTATYAAVPPVPPTVPVSGPLHVARPAVVVAAAASSEPVGEGLPSTSSEAFAVGSLFAPSPLRSHRDRTPHSLAYSERSKACGVRRAP